MAGKKVKNADPLTGNPNYVDHKTAGLGRTIFELEERPIFQPGNFSFTPAPGDDPRGVGSSISLNSDLFDSQGNLVATKEATYTAIKERGNGDIVARGEEIITFLDDGDKIFTSGKYNRTDNEAGETSRLRIVGGTGDFDDAKGFTSFTQLGEPGQGLYDSIFVIVGTPDLI